MKQRTGVSIERAKRIQQRCKEHGPNRRFTTAFHVIAGKLLVRPNIVFGSEEEQEEILNTLCVNREDHGVKILAFNHQRSLDDVKTLAAFAQHLRELRDMRGTTYSLAKVEELDKPVKGTIAKLLGLVPVMKDSASVIYDDEIKKPFNADTMNEIVIPGLNNGYNFAIATQGSRGEHDSSRVQTRLGRIFEGVGRAACGVDQQVRKKLLIVPIGIIYGPEHDDFRHPTIGMVDPLIVFEEDNVESLMPRIAQAQQDAINLSYDSVTGRREFSPLNYDRAAA